MKISGINTISTLLLLFLFCRFSVSASAIRFDERGVLECETFSAGIVHRDRGWNSTEQRKLSAAAERISQNNSEKFRFPFHGFQAEQTVTRLDDNRYRLTYSLTSSGNIETNSIYFLMTPFIGLAEHNEVRLNGRAIPFPLSYDRNFTRLHNNIRTLELPLNQGFLQWKFAAPISVKLEDLRQYNIQAFDIRLLFTPSDGALRSSKFEAEVSYTPYQVKAVALKERKNGQQDTNFRYIPFCLEGVKKLNENSSPLSLNIPSGSRTLFLLHSADLPSGVKAADLELADSSGRKTIMSITVGRETGSLKTQTLPARAFCFEEGIPDECGFFYVTAFELPEDVERAGIIAAGNYLFAGAACSRQRIPLRSENGDYMLKAGKDWRRIENRLDVIPGSALDFSSFAVDAPAGKYGRTIVRDGHFQFSDRPGVPVRFYGVNLCFSSCFPSREQADIIAQRLARQGFNAVRFHHFDHLLVKDLPDNYSTIDPEKLDRMEYLVYALKKAGIYITLDLFTIRSTKPDEVSAFPEGLNKYDILNYKIAVLLYPEVRNQFKTFIKTLLTHKNPYTGQTWLEDPAFNHISVLNENNPRHLYDRCIPAIKRELEKQTREYCRQNRIELTDKNKRSLLMKVLMSRYDEYWRDMVGFLRDIGVKNPLTEQNFCSYPYLHEQRRTYDYVDNHKYWDHPSFGGKQWGLPMFFLSESALAHRGRLPKWLGNSRVFGKPYTVTEMNFCYPNSYRAEGALLYSAVAGLQDWDGIYHYDYADGIGRMFSKGKQQLRIFDICNDMARLIPARIGTALFLRRDVSPAATAYPVAVDVSSPSASDARFPEIAEDLIFRGRTGSLLVRDGKLLDPVPEGTREICNMDSALKSAPVPCFAPEKRKQQERILSDTGEIEIDYAGQTFSLVAPQTEAGIFPAGATFRGRHLSARSIKTFGMIAAITLNGKSFADSSRLLLIHATDCKQENSLYDSRKLSVLKHYGDLQHVLARHGICEISLSLSEGNWKIYALDFDGKRLGEVPFKQAGGQIHFVADTFYGTDRVTFAYELIKEK